MKGVIQVVTPPIADTSFLVQGILSWAIPLGVFLAVVLWYVLLLRRRHPQ
jgi:hypothetical protein